MATVSRYDSPASYEYMQLPYQELVQAGALKQQKFDQGIDELSKAEGALKINADPKHVQVRNKMLQDYNTKLSTLTDEYLKTGDRNSLRKAKQIQYEFASDPNRLQLEENYQNYLKYQPDAQKSTTSGKYRDFYDPYANLQTEEGKVTPFKYSGMKEAGDYVPDMQKLIGNISADKTATEGYKKDKEGKLLVNDYGQLIKTDGSVESISDSKLMGLAKTLAPTFLRTKDAQWFIDERTGKPTKSYDQMSPEEKQAYETEAMVEMFRVGSPQLFSKTSSGVNLQNLPEATLNAKNMEKTTPVSLGATSLPTDPNYRADAPSKMREFFKNFSLTKELYANLYPKEGESIDLNKPFSKDQEGLLKRAEKFYGHTSDNKATQANMINKYLDDWGKFQLNVSIDQYDDPKKVEAENQIYFTNAGKGAKAVTTRKLVPIVGDPSGDTQGSEVTGSDFMKKYGNEDEFAINVTGKLNPDNPYYAAGKAVTVSNKKTGEVVAQYAMSGDNKEMSTGNTLKHQLYKNLKYNPKGEYKLDLPTDKGKETFIFDYEPITTNTLDSEGTPTRPSYGPKERLVVKDKSGEIVFQSEGDDVVNDFYKAFEEK